MSILRRLPDNGCLIYGLFLIWAGILIGLPGIIWDESSVHSSGIAGLVTAFAIPVILGQFEVSFVKDYPLTTIHLCYTFAYSIAMTIFVIGGENTELFISAMFGIVALLISIVVDSVLYEKDQKKNEHTKKCEKVFKVGDEFSIKYYANGCPYVALYTIVSVEEDKVVYKDQSSRINEDNFESFYKKVQDKDFKWVE